MRDGWAEVVLGAVAEVTMGQSPPGSTYNNDGVGLPFIQGSAEFGVRHPVPPRWCSEPRKVAHRGDLLLSVRAPVGDLNFAEGDLAVGRGLAIVRGHRERALTDYLALALAQAAPEMRHASGGTVFESINGAALRAQPFLLPPLAEQRRIVDLLCAADALAEALDQEASAARVALVAFLDDSAMRLDGPEVTVASLISLSIGGDWGGEVGHGDVDLPVYRQTEFTDIGLLRRPADAMRSLSRRRAESRRLRPGDILLQKSAGTPTLPGRVVRCPVDIENAAFSNFLHLLRVNDANAVPAFVFWRLWHAHQTGVALDYQAGTNIRNLDTPRYLQRTLVLLPKDVQHQVAAAADALQEVLVKAVETSERTRALRSAVLDDLLSGDHEMPASYDRFLDGAA